MQNKKLSVVIMAHPERKAMAEELSVKLGGVPIVWDQKNDVWDTCSRAWEAIDRTCEYGLVLQDDCLVCSDFWERADRVLTRNCIYNFFVHKVFGAKVREVLRKGIGYFKRQTIACEVAICMPTKRIDSMLEYCRSYGAQDDTWISVWAFDKGIPVIYPVPCLVQHRDDESIYLKNTKRPNRNGEHISLCFADDLMNI